MGVFLKGEREGWRIGFAEVREGGREERSEGEREEMREWERKGGKE